MDNVTVVTGIWDIKRDELSSGWSRKFDHYLNHLSKLMKIDENMIIFIEEKYRDFVEEHRSSDNTLIIVRELEWFKSNTDVFNKIQDIRNKPEWFNQAPWLSESTQAKLEMYNPIVMSKMFLLNDASILDPFHSTHLIWVDAGGIREDMDYPSTWPNPAKLSSNKIMHFSHNIPFTVDDPEWHTLSQVRNIQGGAFVCPSHMIDWYMNEINKTIEFCLNNKFIGSDEKIFDLTYLKDPSKFTLVKQGWREYYDWLAI